MLGRLRLGPRSVRGRRFPEPPHPYRNDYQRDRDRIIHARAFRRLEGKTQVFAAGFGDHFRNRLTHTIEVSQVARTIASALQLNEEYTETLALAHDLGHSPFGHVGEKELNRQMNKFGDSFEHNRHALRIVDLLEQRYARFDGLNLTYEVREGIVKHSSELGPGESESLDELLPGQKPPLEAQLLDIADEIAYNSADLDDAFSADLLSIEDIGDVVSQFAELTEAVDTQYPGVPPRVRFWEVQRQLMGILVSGLIEGTIEAATESGVETLEDVRNFSSRLAQTTEEAAEVNRLIKSMLIEHVYSYLADERGIAIRKMGELFEFLIENPDKISPGYRSHLEDTPIHRVVCDYIAGMTDAYLLRKHKELLG